MKPPKRRKWSDLTIARAFQFGAGVYGLAELTGLPAVEIERAIRRVMRRKKP